MDPIGLCFRRVPSGDKTFSRFQKGLSPAVNLKPPEPFPTPIKWKEYQLDSLGAAFAASIRGKKYMTVNIRQLRQQPIRHKEISKMVHNMTNGGKVQYSDIRQL